MEGIIFIGIQASGKSTFYKKNFFHTHVRISMDLLNTRNKERKLLHCCLDVQQRVVIDNTNPTKAERAYYIEQFKAKKYKIIGYYFQTTTKDALERNEQRTGKARIPKVGIFATLKKMELPEYNEGFDELYNVSIAENDFVITKISKPNHEI